MRLLPSLHRAATCLQLSPSLEDQPMHSLHSFLSLRLSRQQHRRSPTSLPSTPTDAPTTRRVSSPNPSNSPSCHLHLSSPTCRRCPTYPRQRSRPRLCMLRLHTQHLRWQRPTKLRLPRPKRNGSMRFRRRPPLLRLTSRCHPRRTMLSPTLLPSTSCPPRTTPCLKSLLLATDPLRRYLPKSLWLATGPLPQFTKSPHQWSATCSLRRSTMHPQRCTKDLPP
mmetsp:Transcript_35301/g.75212  ORF Transcript_35301/g.75212 Transcript_35301/m.75212 type:complete len:223 (+) Transcript_35301:1466-2134(+)